MGSGEGDEFKGREKSNKKIWLFVSRVSDTVNEENVKKYIHKRTNAEDIYVKKLDTYFVRQNNQAFLVGIDPYFQEQVYKSDFWPKNIIYSRFNFKQGQRFLKDSQNQRSHKSEENFSNLASTSNLIK
ncbi:unnamed protein product [Psylliodes chrysocephalus]|uniref:Uncharacterized protein n=1 Tax=Psylliodes chrysocephalus TaxID=3402493 RepID=A0A9P0CMJ4_9CUCU|nr:unnamed protein product [Psylliodes chrysocephala]